MSNQSKVYGFVRGKIEILDADTSFARAGLAKLRRACGKPPAQTPEIWDITLQGLPEDLYGREDEELAIHTALTLYAIHAQGKGKSMSKSGDDGLSFGAACGELIRLDSNKEDSIKRRFKTAATATDFTELAHHARGIIQMLKSADIVLDYPLFAKDLLRYRKGKSDDVRLQWGRDFYLKLSKQENEEENK
ncbi:MAG: type I-E CRISPR-associated protein Cse2/CasB [Clostridiales bacterium]|jgi:CRISPR system Cascade subunit CasB|nr:type I-E CRISPR-associated protein Cse2/CasB [Clostridiales bacterium]